MKGGYELLLDPGPETSEVTQAITSPGPTEERVQKTASGTEKPDKPKRKTSTSGLPLLADVLQNRKPASGIKTASSAIARAGALAAAAQLRQKDKFVPLPQSLVTDDSVDEGSSEPDEPSRIAVYCMGEAFNAKRLEALLQELYKGDVVTKYGKDVIQLSMSTGPSTQDAFFFDFGVCICFGLDADQEQRLMDKVMRPVLVGPYPAGKAEKDTFRFIYSATEPPHIKNDCFTINKRQAKTHMVRLAIAHALAQSSKLSVYEEMVWELVEATRHLPETLAETGKVKATTKEVAKLIGRVFLQNTNVNLLSSVLDTPDFFWSAPDSLQALYERACEYLELESRVEVLNARFQVLQEMLDMLRSQQNNFHASRLEYIIIWLLVVDAILMLFQEENEFCSLEVLEDNN